MNLSNKSFCFNRFNIFALLESLFFKSALFREFVLHFVCLSVCQSEAGHSKDKPTVLYPEFDADSESAIRFQYRLSQNGDKSIY